MSTSIVKCPSCGADMIFSPEKGKLYCPYCDSVRDIIKTNTHKRDFFEERKLCTVDEKESVYNCPNCGGEVVLESFVTATKCPFCGATNVIKKEAIKGLKPDGIIPFALSKNEAINCGTAWLKKKWFAHKKFKKSFTPENVNGVYIPAFNFSADTFSMYSGTLGEHYYVTVGTGKNRHQEQRTRWFKISGSISKYFENIMIEASRQLTQKEMNSILPYDPMLVEGYNAEYVSGFSSEKYNETIDQSFGKAKGEMGEIIKRAILSRYHYDVVGSLDVNTNYDAILFNYLLVPMWVFGFKFKDKLYKFLVNGLTGKSTGQYPKSVGKILSIVFLIIGVIVGIVLGLMAYSGML